LDPIVSRRAELGMELFLIAETVFFFLLILAFAYFRAMPRGIAPLGWLFTALLLASTVSMWRAAAESRLWLWVTIALGAAFLAGQSVFFGTTFFTLAGIHGLHILAGLIALAVVPSAAIKVVALYWYFLVVLWLAIVVVMYARSAA
jgi:heme/copper-type cytochrome/quinol oxidase subunit 3